MKLSKYRKGFLLAITIILSVSLLLSVFSCRALREKAKEKEMERLKGVVTEGCVNFTGVWDTNLGDLEILQRECEAEGFLHAIGGGVYKLEGVVTDMTLDFSWIGPKGEGSGYFLMDESKTSFKGETGQGEENTGTCKWDGERVD
jgi:hypothetical protein